MKTVCAVLISFIICSHPLHATEFVDELWSSRFMHEVTTLIRIKSYRDASTAPASVDKNLQQIQRLLFQWAADYNAQLRHSKIQSFEWKKVIDGKPYWLFGLRLGSGQNKVAMITHVDTVPPGSDAWRPFEPRVEKRDYMGEKGMDFLVGRGAIDDKGPSVSAFITLRALAKKYDASKVLKNSTIELIFDTSEETDMATPHYLKDNQTLKPKFGIVFDAMWCVRAEKGIERPQFFINVPKKEKPNKSLWILSIDTEAGPTNQIPGTAVAIIKSNDPDKLKRFANDTQQKYQQHTFDDINYRAARLDVSLKNTTLKLTTFVEGAQHGSAPQQNRGDGANPLVSLLSYLGSLVEEGKLADNSVGTMARFAKWAWGTQVFGETHPELLQASDSVFKPGNGTSYALTKMVTSPSKVLLAIDIRYAAGHNTVPWDGSSEGLLPGTSRFKSVFKKLTSRFNQQGGKNNIAYNTKTYFTPDIRLPNNAYFARLNRAYKKVMGQDCNFIGIGGGTDAKGHPELLAVGPLFSQQMGPPINFHGENEGAPIEHLKKSTHILYNAMVNAVENN